MLAQQEISCTLSHSRETWVSSNWTLGLGYFTHFPKTKGLIPFRNPFKNHIANFRCGFNAKQQVHIKFHTSRKFEEKIGGNSVNTSWTDYLSKQQGCPWYKDTETNWETSRQAGRARLHGVTQVQHWPNGKKNRRSRIIPGIIIVWLHPNFKRTIGVIVVTGDVFIRPVSFRTVRFTYMRSCHEAADSCTRGIQ